MTTKASTQQIIELCAAIENQAQAIRLGRTSGKPQAAAKLLLSNVQTLVAWTEDRED